jgi:ABC-type nickel/cobalt efflux system permease component RcnA
MPEWTSHGTEDPGDPIQIPPKSASSDARGCVRLPGMRLGALRGFLAALGAVVAVGVVAPAAMAADGVGVYGRTTDKVVTFFAFGLIAFFAILVIVLSLIQIRLDNRKERRTQDLERLGSR